MTSEGDLSSGQYRDLAEFRRQIRQFLHFSEATAKEHHIEPQQHQLLLTVQGLPEGVKPTIREIAARLFIQHHSAVELVNRLEATGAIARIPGLEDKREVLAPVDVGWPGDSASARIGPPDGIGTLRPGAGARFEFGAAPQQESVGTLKTHKDNSERLGDFTTTARVIPISLLAIGIGFVSTFVAWALLRLIAFFTNAFYYGRGSTLLVSPAGNHLGWFAVLIPVAGGLVIGLMARYGSERIRGHGIPEALESILINGSKVQPRLAILKPLSSAISIGSGGPFGAEGPIIMTGGAIGSIIAQLFHLTAAERKTLLVAGAAAGMSATFATPVAAVLLAVELLLFEWKPRSAIPVALASATAGAARRYILGLGPLFPVPQHAIFIGPQGLAGCVIAGLLAGILSSLLTLGVYAAEDLFKKLPIHWMWWPAIGGVFVGLGGMIFPQALGVGYDTIQSLLQGDVPRAMIAGVLLVKSAIWIVSLGSGTSGGVLAPLLMMGAALGGVEAIFPPARRSGLLAAGQHGSDPGRDHAGAVHGDSVRPRIDA